MTSLLSGRLLKSGSLPQQATSVSFAYADINARCEQQLQFAREQAQSLIDDAEAEAEQIRLAAQQLGHATGSLQAEAEFETTVAAEAERRTSEQLQYLLPALESAVEQLNRDREQLLLRWESGLVKLSLTLAERLVRRELHVNPAVPRELIAEALQLTAGATSITLKLNPADVDEINAHPDAWQQLLAVPGELQIICEPRVSRGGCLVETEAGEIDGRLETQLTRLAEELLGH